MSSRYRAVHWNRQKKLYDLCLGAGVVLFLGAFVAVSLAGHPTATLEIVLVRATGAAGFVLLHVVLCAGPLARLDRRFLPLVYNRRHLGVTTFLLGFAHAVLVVATYHWGGDLNPLLAVFADGSLADPGRFAFQTFGFAALVVLFLMAATSHDFWLANLGAPVWKALHMGVYLAYGFLLVHVAFGVLKAERDPALVVATSTGLLFVAGLHLAAGFRGREHDVPSDRPDAPTRTSDGWIDAGRAADIPDGRARILTVAGERVAVFRYDGKVSAVSNVCQHQNGPLGEGRILNGCITCPWHGYQYRPDTGAAPPPFTEKIPTFDVRIEAGRVFVAARPNPPGTRAEPARCPTHD